MLHDAAARDLSREHSPPRRAAPATAALILGMPRLCDVSPVSDTQAAPCYPYAPECNQQL